MYPQWLLSVLALVLEAHSAILDIKSPGSRCYQCVGSNRTRCEAVGPAVLCPADRPLCATTAAAPGFESSLTCAAGGAAPCSLTGARLTCTCAGALCNRPFSTQLRHDLANFTLHQNHTLPQHNDSLRQGNLPLLDAFLNSSAFANVTASELYQTITVGIDANFTMPRAEALKHEATLSPDDEDDGEGSGSFDDKTPSAPAAPSSFLPSEHNDGGISGLNSLILALHVLLVLKYS